MQYIQAALLPKVVNVIAVAAVEGIMVDTKYSGFYFRQTV